jgi:hypothetical protein
VIMIGHIGGYQINTDMTLRLTEQIGRPIRGYQYG